MRLILSLLFPHALRMQGEGVDLHYSGDSADTRPRIWVSFPASADPEAQYSLLFDSGSFSTHIQCSVIGVCVDDEGSLAAPGVEMEKPVGAPRKVYIHPAGVDSPDTTIVRRSLLYGTEGAFHSFESHAQKRETIQLIGSLGEVVDVKNVPIFLTTVIHDPKKDLGYIGAARATPLGQIGFTYIPPLVIPIGETTGIHENAGRVIIGAEPSAEILDTLCVGYGRRGMKMHRYPIVSLFDGSLWYVEGSVTLKGLDDGRHAFWMVDTGALGVWLPRMTYDTWERGVIDSGSSVSTYVPGRTKVSNCENYETRFPTITLSIGLGRQFDFDGIFSVEISPREYIVSVAGDKSTCYAQLHRKEGMDGKPIILGLQFLRNTVTQFGTMKGSIGFCHLRVPRAPRPHPPAPRFIEVVGGEGPPPRLSSEVCAQRPASEWVYVRSANELFPGSVRDRRWADYGYFSSVPASERRDKLSERWHTVWSVLDPSATGFHLPTQMFDQVIKQIRKICRSVGHDDGGMGMKISDCPVSDPPWYEALPTIWFHFGMSRYTTPDVYISQTGEGTWLCILHRAKSNPIFGLASVTMTLQMMAGHSLVLDRTMKFFTACRSMEPTTANAAIWMRDRSVVLPSMILDSPPGAGLIGGRSIEPPKALLSFEGSRGRNVLYSFNVNTFNDVSSMRYGGTTRFGAATPSDPVGDDDDEGGVRFASADDGYIDIDAVRVPVRVRYSIGIFERVEETVRIMGKSAHNANDHFEFPIHLDLVAPSAWAPTRKPELGAGPNSDFARAVGYFALIPSSTTGKIDVLVGEADGSRLDSHCRAGESIRWMQNGTVTSPWQISVFIDGTPLRPLIDSTSVYISVPLGTFAKLRSKIDSVMKSTSTAYVESSGDGEFDRIVNGRCDAVTVRKLDRIAILYDDLKVELTGEDYVFAGDDGACYSRLKGVDTATSVIPLGLPFLNKVVAVFDQEMLRVGICRARFPITR